MRLRLSHLLAGGAVYAGATYATYRFFTQHKQVDGLGGGGTGSSSSEGGGAGCCAFDRLAPLYDSTVGSEETYMMYGLMRCGMTHAHWVT
jgi:hypothetical protein